MAVTSEREGPLAAGAAEAAGTGQASTGHTGAGQASTGHTGAGQASTMPLAAHLGELRRRLVVSLVAVAAGAVAAWFLYNEAIRLLLAPYQAFVAHHPAKDIFTGPAQLVTSGPLEGFTTRLKISIYAGVALSCPVLFWQLWEFVSPGLHKNERRYALPFVGAASVLFAGGVTTAIVVFPKALAWLIDVSGSHVVPLFSAARYSTMYASMCLVFGAVFMYPLVVVSLELVGAVPSATWRRWRRTAIVVLAGVAAVITPSSDPFSFLAMAVPMLLLYELAIIAGRLLHK